MLPRIFTGTILSIGCILTVQAAEIAFDRAIEELDTALAGPVEVASESGGALGDCDTVDRRPCGQGPLFAGELPPDIDAYLDCVRSRSIPVRLEGGTA